MKQQMENDTRFITAKADIESIMYRIGKIPKIYAKRGEKLKVVSANGNVLIVENKNGERFSVTEDKVIQ